MENPAAVGVQTLPCEVHFYSTSIAFTFHQDLAMQT